MEEMGKTLVSAEIMRGSIPRTMSAATMVQDLQALAVAPTVAPVGYQQFYKEEGNVMDVHRGKKMTPVASVVATSPTKSTKSHAASPARWTECPLNFTHLHL